ncbi:unnamed protein product [Bursaphelenchus xylophilus]|uniref:(pine wood nematode) hypothetical protein n=1 Tax=Bursaphelenchus xylophilus TaxID=6326 RepID=A0A1I7SWK6_BURXY|nr:unnamed protein product [Bursaphelenchus xylophilus]CAG9099587.1 unnamed protein product [Bursaphelenchus xylophilus]
MLNTSGPAVCRICHSSDVSGPVPGEPLYSPCRCKGGMGLFHRYCLEKWLETSKTTSCEICKFKFQVRQQPPTMLDFLKDKAMRKETLPDLICFLFLTPLSLFSIVTCLYGFFNYGYIFQPAEPSVSIGSALMFFILAIILIVTYFSWLTVTLIHYSQVFRGWRRVNTRLRVKKLEDSRVTEKDSVFSTKVDIVIPMMDKTASISPPDCEVGSSPGIQIPDSFTSNSVARSFTATSTPRQL